MSGGTISPRIVLARLSSCVFHSGPTALVTVRPFFDIIATAFSSSFGTASRRRLSTPSAAASSFGLSASGIAFHAFIMMMLPATIGASPSSSM